MTEQELSELTDEELLAKAKSLKSNPIVNATLVGFMIGIIIFSAVKSTIGFFTLIPLFFIYMLVNQSKERKALEKVLKERGMS